MNYKLVECRDCRNLFHTPTNTEYYMINCPLCWHGDNRLRVNLTYSETMRLTCMHRTYHQESDILIHCTEDPEFIRYRGDDYDQEMVILCRKHVDMGEEMEIVS